MFFTGGFELRLEVGHGVGEVEVAGVGDGESVGGVEVARGLGESEDGLEDGGYLFFGGVTVACDVLFDDGGFVFGDGEVAGDGGSDSHTLSASQFEGRHNVFSEERGFDGQMVGVERVDEADGAFEDFADAEIEVRDFFEV